MYEQCVYAVIYVHTLHGTWQREEEKTMKLRNLCFNENHQFFYLQAVRLRPDDARAHTNLGAILHLLGEPIQAAISYKEALQLQPNDPTTIANLAKLGISEMA